MMLSMIDDDIDEAAVIGQTVVVKSITLVTKTVEIAPAGRLCKAAELVAAGQLVMVEAHEIMV